MERDPCPWRIFDDVGGAFTMGAVGGGIWNAARGWRNSPKGERMLGITTAVKARSPVLGGNFAAWGLLFASFDCSIAYARRKEDSWNSIIAGGLTGAVLSARMGPRQMVTHAVVGSSLLALIEGFSIFISKTVAEKQMEMDEKMLKAAPPPVTSTLGGTGYLDTSRMEDTGKSFDIHAGNADIYRQERAQ